MLLTALLAGFVSAAALPNGYDTAMMKRSKWPAVLLLAGIVVSVIPDAAARSKTTAQLILPDQWVAADSPVGLRVRLLSGSGFFFASAISGERVEFRIDGQSLGPALTGGDGLAVVRYNPKKTGLFKVRARLMDNPRYQAEETEGLLLYGPIPRSVLVVSISATESRPSDSSPLRFEPPPPMPEAVPVLKRFAKRRQLIYIHGGEEVRLNELRDWLRKAGFPEGPVFIWRLSETGETRKQQVIEELERFKPLARFWAGISRSPAEAEAFLALGMRAVLINEDEELEVPKGVQEAEGWEELSSIIKPS